MSEHLTAAADLAWRMAAAEAASSGHVFIERGHLLVGILSLEKVTTKEKADALRIDASELGAVQAERASLAELLAGLALDAGDLRRAARRALGQGPGSREGPISRSDECKAVFVRAGALGREAPASALLLLAALAESADPLLKQLLADRHVQVAALVKRARAFGGVSAAEFLVPPPGPPLAGGPLSEAAEAGPSFELEEGATPMLGHQLAPSAAAGGLPGAPGTPEGAIAAEDPRRLVRSLIGALCRGILDRHGVSLRVDPEAEDFLARAGFDPATGAQALQLTIERLVSVPLANLAVSGKLARHRKWRAAYEEGGVYLIPDEG
jgi:ATP-dependent Clp protease ATP-binding subunit ClpA